MSEPALHQGDDIVVRPVTGAGARKAYRCPGCEHEIGVGQSHVVAWREDQPDARRHWHTACWRARGRRRPTGRGRPQTY